MGLQRISIDSPPHLKTRLSEALFKAGALGLEEKGSRLIVYANDEKERSKLLAGARAVLAEHTDDVDACITIEEIASDFHAVWQNALEPMPLTPTLVLRPVTRSPAPPGERTLWFHPDVSFGSGEHPTTRLAAQMIERLGDQRSGARLLDVGTGTGVLALVALRSGFSRAAAVDIDEPSVLAARKNIAENGLSSQIELSLGSARDVDSTFPVVCANIISSVLLTIGQDLIARVAPGGLLVLTGLLRAEASEVTEFFVLRGLLLVEQRDEDDWSLLLLQKVELERR